MTEEKKDSPRRLIALVLDKSGSMVSVKKEAIAGFQTQADTIKDMAKDGIETLVTFVQFSSDIEEVCFNVPVDKLTVNRKYEPDGMTRLFDAVGSTLEKLEKEVKEKDSALVIVISDGEENSSRQYDGKKLATKVAELQETGRWTITFMVSKSSLDEIVKLGVARGNISTYDPNYADPLLAAMQTKTAYGASAGATADWAVGVLRSASMGKSFSSDMSYQSVGNDVSDKNLDNLDPKIQNVMAQNLAKASDDTLSWSGQDAK